MILSDKTIKKMIESGELVATPTTTDSVQPASLDIRIGTHFAVPDISEDKVVEMGEAIEYKEIEAEKGFYLKPKMFILATTMEYIELPNNLTAFVEGRSSIGRMGLFIQNAGWVDPGFKGEITLELFNTSENTIHIKPGQRVGQLIFAAMDQDAENPYDGKYQVQKGATSSGLHLDDDK